MLVTLIRENETTFGGIRTASFHFYGFLFYLKMLNKIAVQAVHLHDNLRVKKVLQSYSLQLLIQLIILGLKNKVDLVQ